MSSRVLIIGAYGVLGSLTSSSFEASGWEVVRATRRAEGRPGAVRIDLAHVDGLARAVAACDLVVNCVPDRDLVVERLALRTGVKVLNTSALPREASDRLRDGCGDDASGLVVMNAGMAPGLTNLVAAQLLEEYPAADEVEMVFTIASGGSSGGAGVDFMHRGLTTHLPHDTVDVRLPKPFGERHCVGFAERDRGWLGDVVGDRAVRTYLCVTEEAAHDALVAMNDAGGLAQLPREAMGAGTGLLPTEDGGSSEPVAHWIALRADGQRIAARTVRCTGDYRAAAACTVAFAKALEAGPPTIVAPGAYWPEQLFTLGDVLPGLDGEGIAVVDELAVPR
jgi:hypothetical protein